MNNSIYAYLTTINTAVWMIPLILIIYLLFKRKFKFKALIIGIVSYMAAYAIGQMILIFAASLMGNLLQQNAWMSVALYAAVVPAVSVFAVYFIFNRMIENRTWFGTLGYGIGFSYAAVIAETGIKLFSNLLMAVMIADGPDASFTKEQLEVFNQTKEMLNLQTEMFYINVAAGAVMLFLVNVVTALIAKKYYECGNKKLIAFSYLVYLGMYIAFTMVVYMGSESIILTAVSAAFIVFAIWYLTKSYDAQDVLEEITSRPSPLVGRKISKKYLKKKR